MQFNLRVVIPLLVASMGAQVLSAAPPDSVTGPPPIAVDTHVINDASSPVPVTGDVNANVAGSVDVLGEVDVISVPDSLTDQIDRLIEKVEELAGAEENTRLAPATWIRSLSLNASSSDTTTQTPFGGSAVAFVSTLIISTENDKGVFFSRCEIDHPDCGNVSIGKSDAEFPPALTISFPQPVPLQTVGWSCTNDEEPCEVTVSIIGTTGSLD